MTEQSINQLDETQKIKINQEVEGIRQVEDGYDLLFWAKRLNTDHTIKLIKNLKNDNEIVDFIDKTKTNLYFDSLYDFLSLVDRSQNETIKIKIGRLIKQILH